MLSLVLCLCYNNKKEELRCKFVKFYTVVLSQISRTSHFLLIITTMIVLSFFVTPFSIARISSLRKEGKSAVLGYWRSQGLVFRFKLPNETMQGSLARRRRNTALPL